MAKLGKVCDVRDGTHDSPKYVENGYPLITSKNLSSGSIDFSDVNYISEEDYTKINQRSKVDIGDIIMPMIGTIGNPVIVDIEPVFAIKNVSLIKFINEEVYNRYILYVLDSDYFKRYIDDKNRGGTQKFISLNDIREFDFVLPDLLTQRKIAANLDKVTHTIDLCNAILEKLDMLVKSRFVEMFGEPVYNTKHFTTKHGIDIFKLSNGKPVPKEKRMEDGIPAFGGNGISWYTDDVLYNKDTLVIGRVGFQSGNVHYAKAPLWVTDNAMYISEMIDNNFDLIFLCDLMEHIDFTRYQDAGDLKKITQKPFMNMEFIAPPLELQKQYVSFVEQTDKSKSAVKQVLEKAETLKKALMQEYFG